MCDALHQNMPYSCLYWADLYDFYSENRFQCQGFGVFLYGSNFVRRRFITRKATHLHPVLVLSPMLNIGCVLWGSILHLHKYRFYWQKMICATTFAYLNITTFIQQNFLQPSPSCRIHFSSAIPQGSLQSLQPSAGLPPYKYCAMNKLTVELITRAEFNTFTNTEKAWWIPVLLLLNPDFLYECFTPTVLIWNSLSSSI